MIRFITMLAIALLSLNAQVTGYSGKSTDTLLDLLTSVTNIDERKALNAELQKRLPSMTPEQMERYLTPTAGTHESRAYRGMQDGRIATH
jgi:hypothetical protein